MPVGFVRDFRDEAKKASVLQTLLQTANGNCLLGEVSVTDEEAAFTFLHPSVLTRAKLFELKEATRRSLKLMQQQAEMQPAFSKAESCLLEAFAAPNANPSRWQINEKS